MTAADSPHESDGIHVGGVDVLLVTVASAEEAAQIAQLLLHRGGDRRYIGLVSTDVGPEIGGVLSALSSALAEIICFDARSGDPAAGAELAMLALAEFGFGQDFVYTVPDLSDAIDYARQQLRDSPRVWEGDGLLVIGPAEVTSRARLHMAQPR